jgi:type II secretory pathway component PulC
MSIINDALKKARDTKTKIAASADYGISKKQEPKKVFGCIKSLHIPAGIYIAGLLVFFIAVLAGLYFHNAAQARLSVSVPEAETKSMLLYDQAAVVEQASGRENLIPRSQAVHHASEFLLTGIVHGEGSPMAVINGSVYMAGDKINGFTVSRIFKDGVFLEKNGESVELKVK